MGGRELLVYNIVSEFFESNTNRIWSGFLRCKGETQMTIEDFIKRENIGGQNTYKLIEKIILSISEHIDLEKVSSYQDEALSLFTDMMRSKKMWKKRKIRTDPEIILKIHLLLDALWSLLDEQTKQHEILEAKRARTSFLIFLLLYYLSKLSGKETKVRLTQPTKEDVFWSLGNPQFEVEEEEPHIVVNLTNFEPKKKIGWLEETINRNGAIYDIVFASAFLSALETRIIPIGDEDYNTIYSMLPGKIRSIKISTDPSELGFEKLFTLYQQFFVENYDEFKHELRFIADTFSHVITIVFNIPITKTELLKSGKGDPRSISTLEKITAIPGTYWVFGNPVAYVGTDDREIVAGTIKLKDQLLFRPKEFYESPPLYIHKIGLMKIFRDRRSVQRDYLMLIRVHAVEKKSKTDKEEEEKPIKTVRYVYELLSAIPVSPEVVIKRAGLSEKASVERARDIFFLNDEPSSSKDVLNSLYLLGRAFVPKYALYDPDEYTILGLDQYNALITSVLTYLSPTYSMVGLGMDFDTRIHTLLYGVKGVGKSKLLEFYDKWSYNIFYFSAVTTITEAKFLGGVSVVEVGKRKRLRTFTPGNIVKADGGMLIVDEMDRLSKSEKHAIADAIAEVMSSGFAPLRQVMADIGMPRIRVHASFLGAANPIGGKEGKYIEEALLAMYLLHPEVLNNYLQLMPETLRAVLEKIIDPEVGVKIEEVLSGNTKLDGSVLRDEFKYLASSTPYDFYVIDFVKHPVLTKFADRIDFIIPMYTKVINIDEQFIKSGFRDDGTVVIYDKKFDGAIKIARKDLMSFVAEVQTTSPLYTANGTDQLEDLKLMAIDLSKSILRSYDLTTANKVKNIVDAIDSVRVLSRTTSAREFNIAYKVLHTLLKLYDMDTPNKAIEDAVTDLLLMRYKLLYENPLGITLMRENLRTFLNVVLARALYNTREEEGRVIYYVPKKDIQAHIHMAMQGKVITVDVGRVSKIVPQNTAKELATNLFKVLAGEDMPQGTSPGILRYKEIDGEPCYVSDIDPYEIAQMITLSYGRCGEKECVVKIAIGNAEYKLGTIRWSE